MQVKVFYLICNTTRGTDINCTRVRICQKGLILKWKIKLINGKLRDILFVFRENFIWRKYRIRIRYLI